MSWRRLLGHASVCLGPVPSTIPVSTRPSSWIRHTGAVSDEEAARRRAERADRASSHVEAQRRRDAQESEKAQVLVDRFVERAREAGLPTEELTARPWSGRGRYRTGVEGWYVRRDQSIGVGVDGRYYLLAVPATFLGRFRGVDLQPSPPPLEVGRGARDGEAITLADLLDRRFTW